MALLDCNDPIFDRQVDTILRKLEDGIDREEIAKELGYKNPISLDNYMRRRNFSWDSRQQIFVPAAERYSAKGRDNLLQLHGTSKAALIISLFEEGESDPRDIAKQVGYNTNTELANYMKNKGYVWDVAKRNYVKTTKNSKNQNSPDFGGITNQNASMNQLLESIVPLLTNLKKEEHEPTEEDIPSLPRYNVDGMYCTKAMRMANVLDELLKQFSSEKNITQREIIEIAVIDFFMKYGYKEVVSDYVN